MKVIASLFLTAILCAAAHAQTVKTLGYNTTNGYVVYSGTNTLSFTNAVDFYSPITIYGVSPITFDDGEASEQTRANLGFSTNLNSFWTATNAATAVRALAGSTNTNHPATETIAIPDVATLVFSNGILVDVQ